MLPTARHSSTSLSAARNPKNGGITTAAKLRIEERSWRGAG
jgi:hypothetical protein